MEFSKRLRFFIILYTIAFSLIALIIYQGAFEEISKNLNDSLVTLATPHLIDIKIGKLAWYSEIALACLVSLLPSIYFINLSNKKAALLLLINAGLIPIGSYQLLSTQQILLPVLYLELALIIGTGAAVLIKMVLTSSQADFLRLAFSQFVSEKVLNDLLKNPEKLKLQGKEVPLTVMFIDIRGFTAYSEKNKPIVVVTRLNDLLDKVTKIILDHKGTVDKYIGDAVMAFWGDPNEDKKQATHALEAAVEIRDTIQKETEFRVGIGINHGPAIVGNMGSTRRFDYTAIGDTVNTASRLESATKDLGQTIIVSDSVKEKLQEERAKFKFTDLGKIRPKGKSQGVFVYAPE